MKAFLAGRYNGLKCAIVGLKRLVKEHSIITQLCIAAFFITAGFYFQISRIEWMFQLFCFGLVLSVEGLNTAVEELCDFMHPEHHPKIGMIKDIGAGAVLLTGIFSFIIMVIIYYPYIFS
jgi:diacylglycerol kinase (ATP)